MSKRNVVKVKIEDIKLDYAQDIQPYQSPEQKKEIEKKVVQLQKDGQLKPIKLYDDYKIRDGHLRLFAAKKLGWTEMDATIESYPKEF
jgi:ParB-like chromosome segregation protein Spo0J